MAVQLLVKGEKLRTAVAVYLLFNGGIYIFYGGGK